ncbi:E3 ubiquitin-protein ligase MARCHF2 isoform X2 [Halyomorpha halys]|uniref:E3 ubiquitin-protein ligase MARCHF2 isoform X2 n=1 Tax=Halyomorpha halys TaxID=286706 RepID=UPI0006D51BFF|nr:E3 ubiquitin-protein ligase MARCH2 isoform X2 [Halyomorpha halys]
MSHTERDDSFTRSSSATDILEQFSKEAIDGYETSIESGHDADIEESNSCQFMIENFSFSATSFLQKTGNSEEYFCRICQEENASEPSISPCHCRGTMGRIHRSCLEQWLAASDTVRCEVCGFRFTVRRRPKYNILKALTVWLVIEESRRERLSMVSDSIWFLTAFPLILLTNHQSINLMEILQLDEIESVDLSIPFLQPNIVVNEIIQATGQLTTLLIMGAVSFLDVLYFSWLFLRLHRHFLEWYKWYRTQCEVHLILPENE